MLQEDAWAKEVGSVRSELGEIDEIYKDFDHIYSRLDGNVDIIIGEEIFKLIKMVDKAFGMVMKAEEGFRAITKSPKPPSRTPIKHSVPTLDPKKELERLSADIAKLSVRVRNVGQASDEFENVAVSEVAETFEKASEQLRKTFVRLEKLIPEDVQNEGSTLSEMAPPDAQESKSFIHSFIKENFDSEWGKTLEDFGLVLDEGAKDWAKKAIAGIALAVMGMTAGQAQAKSIVSAPKNQTALATKLANVVNAMVGQEFDVQVVQIKKSGKTVQQLNIIKDGKKIVTVDHLFGTGSGGQVWDKELGNTLGSGSYTPLDAANEVFHSFAKITESNDGLEESLNIKPIKWSYPSEKELEDEFHEADIDQLLLPMGYPKPEEREEAFDFFKNNLKEMEIDPKTLEDENAWRFRHKDYKLFRDLVKSYGGPKDPDSMVRKIQSGGELPMPVVIRKANGSLRLAGGATRVSIASLAGQKVKALVIDETKALERRIAQKKKSIETYISKSKNPDIKELNDKIMKASALLSPEELKHWDYEEGDKDLGFDAHHLSLLWEQIRNYEHKIEGEKND